MEELKSKEPITMKSLEEFAENTPVIAAESGDLYIYDGMDDASGNASYRNGIPHISADVPGYTSRFVIMIRNQNNDINGFLSIDQFRTSEK